MTSRTERATYILNLAVAATTIGAIVTVSLRVYEEIVVHRHNNADRPMLVANWKAYAKGGHRIGNVKVPVTVVMFSDYQCPYCKAAQRDLSEVSAGNADIFSVIYRNFPLSFHRAALGAALAAVCADQQRRFEPMQAALFGGADSLEDRSMTQLAKTAGVNNLAAFDSCLTSRAAQHAVREDSTAGARLGVHGTPTFLVNNLRIVGYPGRDSLLAYIRRAALDRLNANYN
ncbi:MAG TPA: thioredoxin domain-containing protein [Gemmatimonadaceae bacterium]|nr:thioredoxin domain-containing protein [Gemmatimonadaceae bacterium]